MGIIFDMTYESVIGDYYIVPELQRIISIVLFITNIDYSRIEFARLPRSALNDDVI